MTQRVSLLKGENIAHDYDVSKIIESLSSPGVASGLEVRAGRVTPGFGFVPVTRDGKTFRVLFDSDSDITIDTSGTKKVFVEINQANIDDGTINNPNGTGIGQIKTAASYPTGNFIKLASISGGNITDERHIIRSEFMHTSGDENISGNKNFIGDIKLNGNSTNTAGGLVEVRPNGKIDPSLMESSATDSLRKSYTAGEAITQGQAVRMGIVGEDENRVYIAKADDVSKMDVIGIADSNAGAGDTLQIVFTGIVGGLNIPDQNIDLGTDTTISNPGSSNASSTYPVPGQTITLLKSEKLERITFDNHYQTGDSRVFKIEVRRNDPTGEIVGESDDTDLANTNFFDFTNEIILEAGVYYFGFVPVSGISTAYIKYNYGSNYSGGQMYNNGSPVNGDLNFTLLMRDVLVFKLGNSLYLQDNGSISPTKGTNNVFVGAKHSDTEIKLANKVVGEISTTATTGSISLGNAEGYISVNIPGVGIKKVPYYGI